MLTDIEIAQKTKMLNIEDIASKLGLTNDQISLYGKYKAKIILNSVLNKKNTKNGKLILVTAINPTAAGEGKTTVTVGLGQAFYKLGLNSIITLREPSLGPVFGMKGGATGGGYSQVLPMEDINLHFTGDLHAITSANNLLCALIDNHIHQGNNLNIDPRCIKIKRNIDMNDRSLRNIIIGLGSIINGIPREDGFIISVASEIMAILCLAENIDDLKSKIGNILIGYNYSGNPIFVKDLKVQGAMSALLKDAINPNLVQTLEGSPCIIHGGPFANIAHGCNSIIATKLALNLCDYVITEAGFGADLGAEKFFNIKCRKSNIKPDCVVIVATIRALKYNGGVSKENLSTENLNALSEGIPNLETHINNIKKFGLKVIVAINKFHTDTDNELKFVMKFCEKSNVKCTLSDVFKEGGNGGIELAKQVIDIIQSTKKDENNFKLLYDNNDTLKNKISIIVKEIYGANKVLYSSNAEKELLKIKEMGFSDLPICMAKTQYSLSDNPQLLGKPTNFNITISDIRLASGAGFIVCLAGNIMTMPGLPKIPAANNIDIDNNGNITGLF